MRHETVIHVAHAMGRKNGVHYRARAYAVTPFGAKCSFTIVIDDSPTEAEREAIRHVKDMYRRDGLPVPYRVISHGRMSGALVDNFKFGE